MFVEVFVPKWSVQPQVLLDFFNSEVTGRRCMANHSLYFGSVLVSDCRTVW